MALFWLSLVENIAWFAGICIPRHPSSPSLLSSLSCSALNWLSGHILFQTGLLARTISFKNYFIFWVNCFISHHFQSTVSLPLIFSQLFHFPSFKDTVLLPLFLSQLFIFPHFKSTVSFPLILSQLFNFPHFKSTVSLPLILSQLFHYPSFWVGYLISLISSQLFHFPSFLVNYFISPHLKSFHFPHKSKPEFAILM